MLYLSILTMTMTILTLFLLAPPLRCAGVRAGALLHSGPGALRVGTPAIISSSVLLIGQY